MQLFEIFRQKQAEMKITTQELATISGVPLATVARFLRGDAPNAGTSTVGPLARVLGISLDKELGLVHPDAEPIKEPVAVAMDSYAELLTEKNRVIEALQKDAAREREDRLQERKEKRALAIALVCVVCVILAILAVDVCSGHLGFIRY